MELQEQHIIVNENFRSSCDSIVNSVHPDVIKIKNSTEQNGNSNGFKKPVVEEKIVEGPPLTSFLETLMHLFKGNVGPGCYALADSVKNGGLILGPVLTLILGVICVHAQHMLLKCSAKMKNKHELKHWPDYAETVELCFSSSNNERLRKLAPMMKRICDIFICITQLGFCCIYFLFIGQNLKQVLDYYGIIINVHVLVTLVLIPIWLSALITNLKFLGEFI
jgi:solute carrier family 36 (proton-coupled amino acid transporter)